jgi:hypothetical protein
MPLDRTDGRRVRCRVGLLLAGLGAVLQAGALAAQEPAPTGPVVLPGPASGASRLPLLVMEVIPGDDLPRIGWTAPLQSRNSPAFSTLSGAGDHAPPAPASPSWLALSPGTPQPRVYLDGIEVTSPMLLAHLDAAAIERVEVTRHFAEAPPHLGVVVSLNIVTRRQRMSDPEECLQPGPPAPRLQPRD